MIAYSTDLRKRVIEKINEKKMQLKEIAEIFKIDVKTIYKWRKKLEKTGSFEATINYQKGHSHKITDLKQVEDFVKNNPNLSLQEMAEKWGNISRSTINRALHKINFSFKKNNSIIKKKTKKKEKTF